MILNIGYLLRSVTSYLTSSSLSPMLIQLATFTSRLMVVYLIRCDSFLPLLKRQSGSIAMLAMLEGRPISKFFYTSIT